MHRRVTSEFAGDSKKTYHLPDRVRIGPRGVPIPWARDGPRPTGQRVTFTLGAGGAHGERGTNLSLSIAINETTFFTASMPDNIVPPYVPLCTLPPHHRVATSLDLLHAVGEQILQL